MDVWEIIILAVIAVGFFSLIVYAARYARSKDDE
jgi:hypothetical protein